MNTCLGYVIKASIAIIIVLLPEKLISQLTARSPGSCVVDIVLYAFDKCNVNSIVLGIQRYNINGPNRPHTRIYIE